MQRSGALDGTSRKVNDLCVALPHWVVLSEESTLLCGTSGGSTVVAGNAAWAVCAPSRQTRALGVLAECVVDLVSEALSTIAAVLSTGTTGQRTSVAGAVVAGTTRQRAGVAGA